MPRCKRDRFRHLFDAMSLKQSKDCICPLCPVFCYILLSFFSVLQNHEEDLTYTCYQMYVSRTQSPNSTALFPTSFVSLSPLVGAMSPGERQPASHQNMSISIWDLARCEEDWWICQLLSSKKYLKLKPSVWMTSMIHWECLWWQLTCRAKTCPSLGMLRKISCGLKQQRWQSSCLQMGGVGVL